LGEIQQRKVKWDEEELLTALCYSLALFETYCCSYVSSECQYSIDLMTFSKEITYIFTIGLGWASCLVVATGNK
jgi:hypothetical protein